MTARVSVTCEHVHGRVELHYTSPISPSLGPGHSSVPRHKGELMKLPSVDNREVGQLGGDAPEGRRRESKHPEETRTGCTTRDGGRLTFALRASECERGHFSSKTVLLMMLAAFVSCQRDIIFYRGDARMYLSPFLILL